MGFAGSAGGFIFVFPLQTQPVVVARPVYYDDSYYGGEFLSCQVNPEGTQLYLIDVQYSLLVRYTVATPSVPAEFTVIASFPDEPRGSLGGLAIDFTAQVAYVGTLLSDNLYTANLTLTEQSISSYYADPLNSGVDGLVLSQDGLSLYYATATRTRGVPSTINSLQVQAGVVPYPSSPTLVWSSFTIFLSQDVDSMAISGSTLYFTAGFRGVEGDYITEQLYSLTLGNSTATLLYTNEVQEPLAGLVVSADLSRLYFVTAIDVLSVMTFGSETVPWLYLVSAINALQLVAQPVATAYLCLITYALPGNVDYPWSSATQLTVGYVPAPFSPSPGTAVLLVSANGTRTFTNRFGTSSSVAVSLAFPGTVTSSNVLYLQSSSLFDATGVTWQLSSPVQLPGNGPSNTYSLLNVWNASGVTVEGSSTRVDALSQVRLSTIPGFVNVTVGPSNVNALAVISGSCEAPITYTNGLRVPTQPSGSNGAERFHYSYHISDGTTYAVQANLTITASYAFAVLFDSLGSPYQQVVNVTGSRVYTYLPTGQTLLSTITGLMPDLRLLSSQWPDQRFYPYSLLSAAPGLYSTNTAPFLDFDGLCFGLSNWAPLNGRPLNTTELTNGVRLYVSGLQSAAVLVEGFGPVGTYYVTSIPTPVISLQQQSYTLN